MKLRLALTISGAVSLGAFEGGALAALLCGIGPLTAGDDPTIRVDAMGGASAGSITSLLAARCLTDGVDPIAMMKAAWVERDSIQSLLIGLQDAPLSPDKLRDMAVDLLDGSSLPRTSWHQNVPVHLSFLLACLRGLDYEIKSAISTTSVDAVTFVDEATTTIEPGLDPKKFTEPAGASLLDIVLASAANAFGFPPVVLDRTAAKPEYLETGILNFPESGHLWYTDGGTVDNEPLGHTLDLVDDIDGNDATEFRRVHVLVHPHPSAAVLGDAWADPKNQPTWLATLVRADHVQRTQSLYDDLRRAEKTNSRITWARQLEDGLTTWLGSEDESTQTQLAEALRGVEGRIRADRRALGADDEEPQAGATATELLRLVIERVAGLRGKQPVHMEVISPLSLAKENGVPVERMLAGEILGHFGGFFDEHMRTSDFDLGYLSTVRWLENGGLTTHGLSEDDSKIVLEAATKAYSPEALWTEWGDTDLGDVAAHHPFALAGLLGQIALVAARDAVSRRPQSTNEDR